MTLLCRERSYHTYVVHDAMIVSQGMYAMLSVIVFSTIYWYILLLCLPYDNVQCVSIAKNDEETTVEMKTQKRTASQNRFDAPKVS